MTKLRALFITSCFYLGWLPVLSAQSLDQIAAVVDDDVILSSELARAVNNVKMQYAGHASQLPPEDVLQHQVLERLVLVKLQVSRALASGLHVSDDELNQAILQIARQNRVSLEGLHHKLASDGLSYGQFQSSVRDEILLQRLRQSFAMSRVVVSEPEIDRALAQADAAGPQYHLAHILVAQPDGASAAQIAAAHRKAAEIKQAIDHQGLDFQAAAVRFSDSPNALEGGDLGYRSLDEIPSAFVPLLKTLQPGQIIGPIHGPSGFQLLKLIDVRHAESGKSVTVTQYHARHILLRVAQPSESSAVKTKIESIRARLMSGASFEAMARQFSQDPNSKGQGGDLGWFDQQTYGDDFGRHVAALPAHQLSAPIQTPAGWHLVEKLDTRTTNASDANRRAQAREMIGRRKLEEDYSRFLEELRAQAYVNDRISGHQTSDPANHTHTPDDANPPSPRQ